LQTRSLAGPVGNDHVTLLVGGHSSDLGKSLGTTITGPTRLSNRFLQPNIIIGNSIDSQLTHPAISDVKLAVAEAKCTHACKITDRRYEKLSFWI
jgi:hypothetical protein